MKRLAFILIVLLTACHTPTETINLAQTLIMKPEILSAGVTAAAPVIDSTAPQSSATVRIYNDRDKPVTLHLRYYGYDKQGLEIYPELSEKTIDTPARGERVVSSTANSIMASQARLYL